ncbi:hypothetical protein VTN96DRAFT_8665 [Rasamsonia emersonii]
MNPASPLTTDVPSEVPPVSHRKRIDWEQFKEVIRQLYVDQGMPIKDVMESLKVYGIHASRRTFMNQIAKWGFKKNIRNEDATLMVRIEEERRKAGKRTTFSLHGRNVDPARWNRRKARIHRPEGDSSASTTQASALSIIATTPASTLPSEVGSLDFAALFQAPSPSSSEFERLFAALNNEGVPSPESIPDPFPPPLPMPDSSRARESAPDPSLHATKENSTLEEWLLHDIVAAVVGLLRGEVYSSHGRQPQRSPVSDEDIRTRLDLIGKCHQLGLKDAGMQIFSDLCKKTGMWNNFDWTIFGHSIRLQYPDLSETEILEFWRTRLAQFEQMLGPESKLFLNMNTFAAICHFIPEVIVPESKRKVLSR